MILWLLRWGVPLGAVLLSLVSEAWGRPGGGHSYSGGGGGGYSGGGGSYSSGGGGGGGEGGGELIGVLIQLIFQVPQIGVPLTIGIVVFAIWARSRSTADRAADWDSVAMLPPPPPPSLDLVRRLDPEFSQVLFEDFAFRLYAEAHRARSRPGALDALAPYLTDRARAALAQRAPQGAAVEDIVIGAMHVSDVVMPPRQDGEDGTQFLLQSEDGKPYYAKVAITYEANMTAAGVTSYVREQWVFWRQASVRSRPPSTTRAFHCPNCGAPFQTSDNQTCAHCNQVVASGRFDWVVSTVALHLSEDRPPALGGYAPEVGTHSLTITHASLDPAVASLKQEDPSFTREALAARLALVYGELNAAWTERDLTRARPYVSDGLHDYLRYWIESYRRQGLTNKLEGMTITNWQPCKLVRDRHYDAFTVRLWATGRDYTVDGKGKVVGGNPGANRDYSEYWTLIRGAHVRGAPRADKQCPNCGAELKISMAGTCEFCQVHVTAGEFDWVLSKIEQDESYQG